VSGTAQTPETAKAARARWFGLVFIALGVAMIIVDATIVNVAVPSIITDLHITASQAQWVQEAYTLVFAALLLVFGRLSDRFGRRRLFLVGAVVFALASVLAATAGSGSALLAARLVQGVGGAMMLPTSLSLINAGFRGKDRAAAFAIWGSTIGGTAALGPLLGGWLTTDYSWRWAFGINIPLSAAVVVGTLAFVRESRDEAAPAGSDLAGALLSVAGVGLVVFGLIEGRTYGWWHALRPFSAGPVHLDTTLSVIPMAFAAGVVCLLGFAAVERARNAAGRVVLLDTSLFRLTSFRNGNIAAGIVSLGEFGLLFALPLWLQNALGYSAFHTGVVLLALAGGSFVASGLGTVLTKARGPLTTVRVGIALELVGVAGVGLVASTHTTAWQLVPFLFVYGVGVGFATAQLTGVVLAEVPVERSGQGSGTQSTVRQVGSALGIAVLGTVLFTTLGRGLDSRLAAQPGLSAEQRSAAVTAVVTSAGGAIAPLAAEPATHAIAVDAREALSEATRWAAFAAAGFLLLGLAATASLGPAAAHVAGPEPAGDPLDVTPEPASES